MRSNLLRAVSVAAMLAFSGPAFADDYVVMKINNQDISSAQMKQMWEGLFPAGQAPALDTIKPEMRDKILRGMMAEKLLYDEAVKQGVEKSDAVAKQIEDLKRKLVIRTFLDAKTTAMITDADVKNEYDALVSSMKDEKEVRARHILLADEAAAKDAKKKLDEGKSFEDVARDFSKDPGSAKQGGDLGYFTKDKMVKAFADAAFAMKKGAVSDPVKSDFGWHIIKVEDIRKVTVPTMNEVKEQLRAKLQEKKLNDYVGGLVKAAEVKVFDAKGKELSFEKDPAKADKAAKAADKAK